MRVRDYRDLIVWKKGKELAKEVYRLSSQFPAAERWGLASQVQRAGVSIPSNIAEGQSRGHTLEFRQFLRHALGSLAELDTQMTLAMEFGYLSEAEMEGVEARIQELQRMIHTLVVRLSARKRRESAAGDSLSTIH